MENSSIVIALIIVIYGNTPSVVFCAAGKVPSLTYSIHVRAFQCPKAKMARKLTVPDIIKGPTVVETGQTSLPVIIPYSIKGLTCDYTVSFALNLTASPGGPQEFPCSFQLQTDGTFSIRDGHETFSFITYAYCLVRSSRTEFQAKLCGKNATSILKSKLACSDSILTIRALHPDSRYRISYVITVVGCALCIAIDLAIISVYLILCDKHTYYGWSIIIMGSCALVYYASTVALFLARDQINNNSTAEFSLISILAISLGTRRVAMICYYAWALILAYHVWKRLRTLTVGSVDEWSGLRKFLVYCLVGFGLPLVYTGIVLAVISSRVSQVHGFAETAAFYFTENRIWATCVPIGIVFVVSMFFMSSLVRWLREARKNRDGLRVHGQRDTSSPYTNAAVICKLMVLMGAFGVLELVLAILVSCGYKSIYLTLYIRLRGVVREICLFWIFVWNKEIRGQLAARISISCFHSRTDVGGNTDYKTNEGGNQSMDMTSFSTIND